MDRLSQTILGPFQDENPAFARPMFPPPLDVPFEERASEDRRPETEDFDYLLDYYNDIAARTIWTLFSLVALTLFSSGMFRQQPKSKLVAAVFVIAVTFLHLLQWTSLASAYGRLYVPSVVFQNVLRTVDLEQNVRLEDEKWPFPGPGLDRDDALGEPVRLTNYWPIRPEQENSFAVAFRCFQTSGNSRELRRTHAQARPAPRGDGVTVFEGVLFSEVIDLCSSTETEGTSFLEIYDGYGDVTGDLNVSEALGALEEWRERESEFDILEEFLIDQRTALTEELGSLEQEEGQPGAREVELQDSLRQFDEQLSEAQRQLDEERQRLLGPRGI